MRIKEIDIAKGIAIIFVVLGHQHIHFINEVAYSFHMPLFIIISGMFLKKTNNIFGAIKGNAQRLLRVYVITSILQMIGLAGIELIRGCAVNDIIEVEKKQMLASLFGMGGYDQIISGLPYYFEKNCGAIWFLLALFWGSLLVNIIIRKAREPLVVAACVTWGGYWLYQYIHLPFRVLQGVGFTFYLCYGHLLYKRCEAENGYIDFSKISKLDIFIMLVAWGMEIWLPGISEVSGLRYPLGILSVIAGICSTRLILLGSNYIKNVKFIGTCLEWFGKNSLLLCVHSVESQILPWNEFDVGALTVVWKIVLKYLIIIFVALAIKYINKKVRELRGKCSHHSNNYNT